MRRSARFPCGPGDWFQQRSRRSLGALLEGDVGVDALTLDVVRKPSHRRFGDRRMQTSALSTSAVPIRWPETLMTSSTRPVIQ